MHERLLTLDTHLDTPIHLLSPSWDIMQRHAYEEDLSQVDYPRLREGGLDGGFWAIFTPQGPRTPEGYAQASGYALQTVDRIVSLVARHPRYFELATRATEASEIAARGKRIVYLSVENAYPLGLDLSLLPTFYDRGVRMLGLVHTRNNDLADSSTDENGKEWGGLSPLGRAAVVEANRLGMVLDASHASDDVLDQLIEQSKTPIILSHSGCAAVYAHPRNVDDARLRKLAASGGVIQLNSLGSYLTDLPDNPAKLAAYHQLSTQFGPLTTLGAEDRARYLEARRAIERQYPSTRATFDDYIAHLLHALQTVGPQHVGIGADWDGGGGVTGMEDVAGIPRITERLLAEGYREADLADLWSGNVLRLLRAAEAYRQQLEATAQR
ncbi:MAG: peptidase [Myxococcaceae bacterium]|nr:peptidase [Myxococcaceae bacterium]